MSDSLVILEHIKEASKMVRKTLAEVGNHAAYLYPKQDSGDEIWKGYSYEIPKEEQIRSAFWAGLHDPKNFVCELEWDVYEKIGQKIKITGEIDIVGFSTEIGVPKAPVMLLEIKRFWNLSSWNNKVSDQKNGIESDIGKLNEICTKIALTTSRKPFAGVIVVGFTNDDRKIDLNEYIDNDKYNPVELWSVDDSKNESFPCERERNNGKSHYINICTRADLIKVT